MILLYTCQLTRQVTGVANGRPIHLDHVMSMLKFFTKNMLNNGDKTVIRAVLMEWQPVQGVPHLLPNDSWDKLQSLD